MEELPASRLPPALQTLSYLASPLGFFDRARARHGPIFRACPLPHGDQIFVSRRDLVREVLTGDPDLLRGGEANSVLLPVVGPGSVSCLDGDAHAARRRLLAGAFPSLRRGGHAEAIGEITLRELGALPPGEPVSLTPALHRITLEVMLRAVFGDPYAPGVHDLGAALARLVDLGALPFSQLGALPALRTRLGGLSPWAFFERELARVDTAIHAQIARFRAHPGGGILGGLMAPGQGAGGLGDRELRDELMTLLGAGYDTTATALAWALEQLALHPEALERVETEARSQPAGGPRPFLDAVILESLRRRPVLPAVARIASEEMRLGGHRVPARSRVVLCIYLAHHEPGVYPEPGRFLPGRFLEKRPDPYAWLPFGGGPRRCPGMALALEEMRLVLAAALARFSVELARPRPSRPVFRGTTLAPAASTRFVLRPRLGARQARW